MDAHASQTTARGLRRRDHEALAAIADALVPPGGRLPGAGPDEGIDAAAAIARFLGGVPPRQRLAVLAAVRSVEWLSGRRFSRLGRDARTRRLERLGRLPLGRDVVLLLKALVSFGWARDARVQEQLGVEPRCELAPDAEHPRPDHAPLERETLEIPPDVVEERCDVVVVGSGAGGATAARLLAEAGLDVIVLEEGELHDSSSYTTDPLAALGALYRDGGLTVLEGMPAIPLPLGRCVGGTTVINSGTCVRTPGDVLAAWRDTHGIAWAPQLEQEWDAVERDLAVSVLPDGVGGGNADVCRRGADALGISSRPVKRNAGQVVRCGTCPTGCMLDAKQAMHVSELPRVVAAGARVRAGIRVESVAVAAWRATGVVARRRGGERYAVHARAVVLAAGAVGTPELLLRNGISAPQLGRNLHVQPACWVGGRFDENVRGWEGVMQSRHVDEWRRHGLFLEATFTPLPFGAHWLPGVGEAFKRRVEDIGRLAVIGVHLADRSAGRVRLRGGAARLGYRLSRAEARTLGFGVARAGDILFAAGAREVYPQVAGVESIPPGGQRVLEQGLRPAQLRLEAFHPMGTARMGADGDAVVGVDGQLRALRGVYVADASVLPTALGVNPMITIVGVARRIARGLAQQLS